MIAELTASKQFAAPIMTEVTEATTFYPVEDYHQRYFEQKPQQPYCQFVVAPKVAKARVNRKRQIPTLSRHCGPK